jgi:hypothetical protein
VRKYIFNLISHIFIFFYYWGLGFGIGDWGFGIGDLAQSPIPNSHEIN